MAEDFKIQLSVKIGYGHDADMVNIRANTPEEFAALLQHAQVNADLVAATSARLKGAGAVVALTSPAQAVAAVAPVAPVAAPVAAPVVQAPSPYLAPGGPTGGAITAPQPDVVPQPVAPVAAPAAGPAGVAPLCVHGARQFRASKPGAAKAWQAWMCPTAKGTPGQCDPEWIQ